MIRLTQMRLDQRLSVPQLANLAGVSPKVVYRLEATGRAGHAEHLGKVADALGVKNPSVLLMPAVDPEIAA